MIKPRPRWVNSILRSVICCAVIPLTLFSMAMAIQADELENPVIDHSIIESSSAEMLLLDTQENLSQDDSNVVYVGEGDGIIAVVGSPYVELYDFPGRAYPRFHAIEKKERIRIFKNRSDWYKIQTEDGKIGWAPRKHLTQLYDLDGNLLDFSTPKWGETKNPWQLGLLGGTIENAPSYSIYAGYRFTQNISTELRFTQTFGEFSNIKQVHLMLVHQPFPNWRVTPFFTLGAGTVKIYPDTTLVEVDDQVDNAVTVGGGLMFYLAHNVLLRADYNSHLILTTRDQNEEVEEWKAGFSVLF